MLLALGQEYKYNKKKDRRRNFRLSVWGLGLESISFGFLGRVPGSRQGYI